MYKRKYRNIYGELYVADTMAVVMRLDGRLVSKMANKIFDRAERGDCCIYISAFTLAEIGALNEKGHIKVSINNVMSYKKKYDNNIIIYDMEVNSILAAFEVKDIPELHDRLIVGVAKLLDIPIITNDSTIQESKYVKCVW